MAEEPDYRGLAARTADGDREAFDGLVRALWRPVLGFFWRRLPRALAEELAQTVFVNVYRALRRGAGRELDAAASWSRYVFGAARNVLREHWRAQSRAGASPQEPEAGLEALFGDDAAAASSASAAQAAEHDELRAALEACLDRLERGLRQLVFLHFVDGRAQRELARALDRPESSVRAELVRALQRLRRCLQHQGAA